jgi:peptidyl-prolyl cis-trans isomerase D
MLDKMRDSANSWIIKAIFAIIIIVFVFAFGMGQFSGKNDPAIAYVDDTPISTQEFMRVYRQTADYFKKQNPNLDSDYFQSSEFKKMILGRLVNSYVLRNEAEKLGITFSKTELYYSISSIPFFHGADKQFDKNIYNSYLRANHMSAATFEHDQKISHLVQKLQTYVALPVRPTEAEARDIFNWAASQVKAEYIAFPAENYSAGIKISDKQIEEYYNKNQEKFRVPETASISYLEFTPKEMAKYEKVTDEEIKQYYEAYKDNYKQDAKVKASHILISVDENADKAEVKKAKAKIEKIYAQAKKGADFAKLAQKYSEGPSSTVGGELGWFDKKSMVKPFADKAFSMKVGDVSEPVRTRFGFHIIKLEDKKEAGTQTLADVKSKIKATISEDKAAGSIHEKLDNAIDMAASGMKLEKIADEIGVVVKQVEKTTVDALKQQFGMKPEAAKTVFNLAINTVSEIPVAIDNGYIIVQKDVDTPSFIKPLKDVKDSIVNYLEKDHAKIAAKTAAEEVLKKLIDPKTAKAEQDEIQADVRTTEAFGRNGFIPGLGMSKNLVEDTFNAADSHWLNKVYELEDGYVIARLDERIPPKEGQWEKQKEVIMNSLQREQTNTILNSFVTELRKKADIKITRPDVLK